MDKWVVRNRSHEISVELTKLLGLQTEYLAKRNHTSDEVKRHEQSRDRVRELFKELADQQGSIGHESILSN